MKPCCKQAHYGRCMLQGGQASNQWTPGARSSPATSGKHICMWHLDPVRGELQPYQVLACSRGNSSIAYGSFSIMGYLPFFVSFNHFRYCVFWFEAFVFSRVGPWMMDPPTFWGQFQENWTRRQIWMFGRRKTGQGCILKIIRRKTVSFLVSSLKLPYTGQKYGWENSTVNPWFLRHLRWS